MRLAVSFGLALAACSCSAHDSAPAAAKRARTAPPPPVVAPGLRLPDGVAPLAYDLRLELDPDSPDFRGHVEIRVHLTAPTDHVWLHADELDLAQASYRDGNTTGRLEPLPVAGDQMRAFGFGHVIDDHEITLAFDYTGHTLHDQEGLFRQHEGGRWYLFSQGESLFARRILPCFDEPRFKVPWKLTLVVPSDQIALANTPQLASHALPDGRRELVFAQTPAMASYLLALAVGPFELVDAGKLGKNKIPVRVAALAGQRDRVGVATAKLPELIATAEDFLEDALPLAKLDLVVVPHLFGAMENPGLVTIEESAIVGDAQRPAFVHRFVKMIAHELVHQWFGNLVTPAWWDDLWLAEAFASWLGDRIAAKLDAFDDPALYYAFARRDALAADAEPDARPLRRHIEHDEDPDNSFDTIAYDKGEAVLETFDRASLAWGRGLQRFLHDHRNGSATLADLVAALGDADDLAHALVGYVEHAGAPVVDLTLTCEDHKATLAAHARDGLTVPVCLRYGDAHAHMVYACKLVGDHDTFDLTLADGCPTYVFGNRHAGYYETAWHTNGPLGPLPPLDELQPGELIAAGDDVVAAIDRGELGARDALAALRTLAQLKDPYALLGAVAIARALDPAVPPSARGTWSKQLASAFASRLAPTQMISPVGSAEHELRDELAVLVPASALPAETVRRAARELDLMLGVPGGGPDPALAAIAAPVAGKSTFDQLAQIARDNHDPDVRENALDALGQFGVDQAPRAVELFVTATELPPKLAWTAVAGYFARADTRDAAWRAVRARLPEVLARMPADDTPDVVATVAQVCDPATRAEVSAAFEPHVRDIPDGRRELDRALAQIARCVARRGQLGDIAAALRN